MEKKICNNRKKKILFIKKPLKDLKKNKEKDKTKYLSSSIITLEKWSVGKNYYQYRMNQLYNLEWKLNIILIKLR